MYEDFDSFKNSTPSFYTDAGNYARRTLKSKENTKDLNSSASVANCIRALTQKTATLTKENQDLKQKNCILMQEVEDLSKKLADFRGYKEKCLIFEQSNEIFKKKIGKLEETAENYESLKAEMVLLNKELTREIEKNKKLLLENDQIKDKTLNWQNTYSNLGNLIKKRTNQEDFREKDNKNLKFLEDLIEKQQNELDGKRNLVDSLKEKVNHLEDTVFLLKKDKQKLEIQVQQLEDINERLLKALKKKNHVCRHRASTPDIAGVSNVVKSYENFRMRDV